MADVTVYDRGLVDIASGANYKLLLHDNGDGTFSPVVYAAPLTGATASQTQGNVAHDAVDSGNPVKIGGKAETTTPTAVADGDRVDAWFDELGRQVTKDGGPAWTTVWGVNNAPVSSADMSGADADLTAAPTSQQKWVITDVFVSVDTAMRVDIKEETSGLVMFSGYLPANSGFQQLCPRGKRKLAVADKKVVGRTSAAGNVRILVGAYSEA